MAEEELEQDRQKYDDLLKEIERENTLAEKAAKEKIIKKTELRYESH